MFQSRMLSTWSAIEFVIAASQVRFIYCHAFYANNVVIIQSLEVEYLSQNVYLMLSFKCYQFDVFLGYDFVLLRNAYTIHGIYTNLLAQYVIFFNVLPEMVVNLIYNFNIYLFVYLHFIYFKEEKFQQQFCSAYIFVCILYFYNKLYNVLFQSWFSDR